MKKSLLILLAIMALCASSCCPTYNIIINPAPSESKSDYIRYMPIPDRWNNSHLKTKIGCDSINVGLFRYAD